MFGRRLASLSLPPLEEQAALLESLEALYRSSEAAAFRRAPIVLPTPEFFPDPWSSDVAGANGMIGRLLGYAGLGSARFSVKLFSETEGDEPFPSGVVRHSEGVAARFLGTRKGHLHFEVEADGLKDPDYVVGVLAHEVAHAFRREKGLEVSDHALEEQLTDLTTVFLGFGVLTANASDHFRSQGDAETHSWSHRQAGYLSPLAMSFLLAAQLTARGDRRETKRARRCLAANQRTSFKAAMKVLAPRAARLHQRFVLGEGRSREAEAALPGPAHAAAALALATVRPREEKSPEPVFRVRHTPAYTWMLLTVTVFFWMLVPAALTYSSVSLLLCPPLTWGVGRLLRGACSHCDEYLSRRTRRCPHCGGQVVGEIATVRDRFEARERYDREHGHGDGQVHAHDLTRSRGHRVHHRS